VFLKNSIRDSDADGVLLHELVHASRMMSGADESCTVEGGYGNSEEFYANTIKMIYRSETGLPVYDYKYRPFEPGSFLDRNMARVLLAELRTEQQSLFLALAKVDVGFNPIKQLEDARRKLVGGQL
jgi:hypothetical protein